MLDLHNRSPRPEQTESGADENRVTENDVVGEIAHHQHVRANRPARVESAAYAGQFRDVARNWSCFGGRRLF